MDPPNVTRVLAGRSLIAITAIAQVIPILPVISYATFVWQVSGFSDPGETPL
jgi:hypothetical protein